MSTDAVLRERLRWRCRRGMLELDLVLQAFVGNHLAELTADELDALGALLERPDPELLDYVMDRATPPVAAERELIALMRRDTIGDARSLYPRSLGNEHGEFVVRMA